MEIQPKTSDEYEDAARKRWEKIISGRVQDYYFTKDKYDPVDGYLTGNTGQLVVFELKNRDVPFSKYEKEGFLIEKKKWLGVMGKYTENKQDQALYVNLFQDRDIAWDISKLPEPEWDLLPCTRRTCDGGYKRGEVNKLVGKLWRKDAIWERKEPTLPN